MLEKLFSRSSHPAESLSRSIVKTVTYRVTVLTLDFTIVYILTGQIKVAVGFMVISNIYTTITYFFHERIWDNIGWGKIIYKKEN